MLDYSSVIILGLSAPQLRNRYQDRSLPVIPVNPTAKEVEGLKAVANAVSTHSLAIIA